MRSLYLPKQKELSLTKIREELTAYFRKNGAFPYDLGLDVEDWLEFARLFKEGEIYIDAHEGFEFMGIKVVPYNDENR